MAILPYLHVVLLVIMDAKRLILLDLLSSLNKVSQLEQNKLPVEAMLCAIAEVRQKNYKIV